MLFFYEYKEDGKVLRAVKFGTDQENVEAVNNQGAIKSALTHLGLNPIGPILALIE